MEKIDSGLAGPLLVAVVISAVAVVGLVLFGIHSQVQARRPGVKTRVEELAPGILVTTALIVMAGFIVAANRFEWFGPYRP